MTYTIKISKKIDNFINKQQNSQQIKDKLFQLKNFKYQKLNLDIKSLKGKWIGFYRLRIGSIRFIFRIDEINKLIIISKADFRGSVY